MGQSRDKKLSVERKMTNNLNKYHFFNKCLFKITVQSGNKKIKMVDYCSRSGEAADFLSKSVKDSPSLNADVEITFKPRPSFLTNQELQIKREGIPFAEAMNLLIKTKIAILFCYTYLNHLYNLKMIEISSC